MGKKKEREVEEEKEKNISREEYSTRMRQIFTGSKMIKKDGSLNHKYNIPLIINLHLDILKRKSGIFGVTKITIN